MIASLDTDEVEIFKRLCKYLPMEEYKKLLLQFINEETSNTHEYLSKLWKYAMALEIYENENKKMRRKNK